MGWDYLSIPKLQWLHRWSLGMGKLFHPKLFNGCNYLSVLGLMLNHVSKKGHGNLNWNVGHCECQINSHVCTNAITKYNTHIQGSRYTRRISVSSPNLTKSQNSNVWLHNFHIAVTSSHLSNFRTMWEYIKTQFDGLGRIYIKHQSTSVNKCCEPSSTKTENN